MTDIKHLVQNVIDREQAKFDRVIAEFEGDTLAETEQEKAKLKQEYLVRQLNLEKDLKGQSDISGNSISLRKRDKILGVKRQLIDQYIQDIQKSFIELDQEAVKEFISSILKQYQGQEGIVLQFGSKTKTLLADSIHEITQGFTLSDETLEGQAGFILQDGSLQYNYLFDNLVNDSRKKLEAIIVNQLFNN